MMMTMFPIMTVDVWTVLLLLGACLLVVLLVFRLSRRKTVKTEDKNEDSRPPEPAPQRFVTTEKDVAPTDVLPEPQALEPLYVPLTKEFPDLGNELIYVASEEDEDVNNFLQNLPFPLLRAAESVNLKIVYLPTLVPQLIYGGAARYRHPSLPAEPPYLRQYVRNDFMLQFIADESVRMKLKRGFLCPGRLLNQPNSTAVFLPIHHVDTIRMWFHRLFGFSLNLDDYVERQVQRFRTRESGMVLYELDHAQRSLPRRHKESPAPERQVFTDDIGRLMEEVKERVDRLRQHGVAEYILETLFRTEDTLSRLVITSDHRLLLPDYSNMEIKMEPLVKAVYLLFLRHPEGIAFKDLPDYRQELTDLYRMLRPTGLTARARASIDDVTNPLSNSINEKCARIRAAFLTQFDDRLAQHYYITGQRANPKLITLPRELVVWK